jgi:hypothetical protein
MIRGWRLHVQNVVKRTVYVLGAGVNKSIRIKYGVQAKKIEVSPPLAKDFFQVAFAMAHGRFEYEYKTKFKELLLYIKKYWKKDFYELTTSDFDLEECFTLIELQLMDPRQNKHKTKLSLVEYQLKLFL